MQLSMAHMSNTWPTGQIWPTSVTPIGCQCQMHADRTGKDGSLVEGKKVKIIESCAVSPTASPTCKKEKKQKV